MKTNHIFCCGERVNEISLCYDHPPNRTLPKVNDLKDAMLVMKQCFDDKRIALKEFFFAMYLNNNKEVLAISCIGVGTENYVPISIKEIVSNALLLHAKGVVVAHNHPHGTTVFSQDDLRVTKQLIMALDIFSLDLVDHFLFTKTKVVSLFGTHPEIFES